MNSLHKVLELARSRDLQVALSLEDSIAKKLVNIVAEEASKAICFDMGEIDGWDGFEIIHDLTKLPYPVCWFEGFCVTEQMKVKGSKLAALCWEDETSDIHRTGFICLVKKQLLPWLIIGVMFKTSDNKMVRLESQVSSRATQTANSLGLTADICGFVFVFLSALNCNNVKAVENKPPEKLQKKRAKTGKLPFFSSWTLHLKLPKSPSQTTLTIGETGSHSLKRVHFRRRHPRQYRPGKWTWVSACMAGTKQAGFVYKDYEGTPIGLA